MANRYWVGGTGNWDQAATTHWSASDGGASGASVPVAGDDVFFTASSGAGTCTLNANAPCRSLQSSGSAITTFTHNTSINLTIGDATAGASNIALDMSGFTTYSPGSSTAQITFASSSGTVQTIKWKSAFPGRTTFSGTGSWQFLNGTGSTGSGQIDHTNGTLDFNGQTFSVALFTSTGTNTRTLTCGAAAISIGNTWQFSGSGLTFNTNTSTITMTGAVFDGNGNTFNVVNFNLSSSTVTAVTGANTFATLTYNASGSGGVGGLSFSATPTITGTFTAAGNSLILRAYVLSGTPGTQITISAAVVSISNVDFTDIVGGGGGNWTTGTSIGNLNNNSGITFTPAVTRYKVGANKNYNDTAGWSTTAGGASGATVPLCHDTVVYDTSGTGTHSFNQARIPAIDLTNATNLTTITLSNTIPIAVNGGWVIPAATFTLTVTSSVLEFVGRTGITFNPNGYTYASVKFSQWNVTTTVSGILTCTICTVTASCTADFGSNNLTITGTGAVFTINGTLTASTSTINLSSATGNTTINSAGNVTITGAGSITASGGAFTNNGTITFTSASYSNSTYTANSGSTTTMGSGTWTVSSTGTVWNCNASANITANSSTISMTDASSTAKTFGGGGKTYATVSITTGGSGIVTFTGSNTFSALSVTGGSTKTIKFTAATTTTLTAPTFFSGAASNLITIDSTSTTNFTLSCAQRISVDYINLANSTGSDARGIPFYAGANSVDGGGGNLNWIFTAPPGPTNNQLMMGI